MKYKMVVFDLDGTLLFTLEDLYLAVNHCMRTFGFPERDRKTVRKTVGNGIHKLIEDFVPEARGTDRIEEIYQEFMRYYNAHCKENTRPYDGILELVDQLREDGYLVSVLSNKGDFAVQELCKQYFGDKLDFALGLKDGLRRKPYPDTLNTILKEFDLQADEAVYVGDSEVDVELAKNAHMDCISVTWGFRDREIVEALNPGRVADTPDEVLRMIESA